MDNKAKIVIVVLVVIGILFGFSLVARLAPKQGEDDKVAEYDTSGWVSYLDGLMSSFSPKLDRKRIKQVSGCKKISGSQYQFVSDKQCIIDIQSLPDDADDDYQTATLRLGKKANVRVPCPPEGEKTKSSSKPGPTINIFYTPEGEDRATRECEGSDEVRLVVQKKGGKLDMQCKGCTEKRPIVVELE